MKGIGRYYVLIAFAMAIGVAGENARADIDGDTFTSGKPWQIRITAPVNWRMSEQRSYGSACSTAATQEGACKRNQSHSNTSILLWMHRRSPQGKMLLAAERLDTRMSSLEYAEKTRELLGTLGFQARTPQLHAATGAYWLELDNGTSFLRQAVLVSGEIGYSLTLAAPDARTRASHLRAFDYALRKIRIQRDSDRASEKDPPGQAPGPDPDGQGAAQSPNDGTDGTDGTDADGDDGTDADGDDGTDADGDDGTDDAADADGDDAPKETP